MSQVFFLTHSMFIVWRGGSLPSNILHALQVFHHPHFNWLTIWIYVPSFYVSCLSRICCGFRLPRLANYLGKKRQMIIPFVRSGPKTSEIWDTTVERNKLRNKKKSCHQKAKGISDLIGSFHYTRKAIKSQMLTSAWHCATCAKTCDNNNPDLRICWWRLHWYLAENHKHRWQIP